MVFMEDWEYLGRLHRGDGQKLDIGSGTRINSLLECLDSRNFTSCLLFRRACSCMFSKIRPVVALFPTMIEGNREGARVEDCHLKQFLWSFELSAQLGSRSSQASTSVSFWLLERGSSRPHSFRCLTGA